MERREFLKLSSLFSIGAIIGSNALKAMESISSLVSPSYIYKVRHRIGFWIAFSMDTPDLKSKMDFAEKMDSNLFYKDSLELVEVCEESLCEDKIESIESSLNDKKEVRDRVEDNIKIKQSTSNNFQRGSSSRYTSTVYSINITGDGDKGEKIKIPLGIGGKAQKKQSFFF
jgi:hypothetical protein